MTQYGGTKMLEDKLIQEFTRSTVTYTAENRSDPVETKQLLETTEMEVPTS